MVVLGLSLVFLVVSFFSNFIVFIGDCFFFQNMLCLMGKGCCDIFTFVGVYIVTVLVYTIAICSLGRSIFN